jgi:hypothetical protein
MITAERLMEIINITPAKLSKLVNTKGVQFESAKFLGITNGGELCFDCSQLRDGELVNDKVFIRLVDPPAEI